MNTKESIIECVPNFSEGTNVAAVREIVHAMQVDGVSLLDYSLDPDHNRSVVTLAGAPGPVMESVLRGVGKSTELINMTAQHGVHPRIGAADVVPLVPIRNISLPECAALAHQLGQEIWKRYHVPVYFYEAAALRPDRRLLENIRNGQFEGLRKKVQQDAASREFLPRVAQRQHQRQREPATCRVARHHHRPRAGQGPKHRAGVLERGRPGFRACR